ncbi:hypothetical protein [Mucilaginibacter sp.]|uniref:glycosyl-4,4'-diaponeurosporenoate acyltransferase CrtO family protein n=1 Tax=Mucilaginibacter sp. TaxID=1882438 RepID=UPI0032655191
MRKTFTLTFIVLITIALTYALAHYMKMDSFAFAWALNFLLMACVLNFTEALKEQLVSRYYDEQTWERGGKIYQSLGVNFYRKLLVWIGWEKLNKKSNPVEKNTEALIHLHNRTKKSELGHLLILIIVLGFNIFVAFKFGILQSLWLLGLNILFNLYPILLQRYNRPRIVRAVKISERR